MPVYEVLVLKKPTQTERLDGKLEELIVPITPVIASDEKSASMKIMMDNQDVIKEHGTDRLEVLVRPF